MKRILLLIVTFLGFNIYAQNIDKDTIQLKEVEVVANLPYQATNRVPITFKNLTQKDLSFINYGQEPSQILSNTPSMTTYSESGSVWGYSYIRLRGIDQTRINMTLNGVPLNEPEDQGCYFSNYPDFLQSIKVMQIQRGIGMSKNGIANFAGSLNFESLDPQRGLDFSAGFGSFDSKKYSVGLGIKNLYARFSSINSDGFREHSGNKSKSFFLASEGKYKKHTLKMIAFVGNQKNKLAWLGSTKEQLDLNPKYNACTDNEHDNFTQMRLQLHHNYEINTRSSLNSAVYYNYLEGWYTYQHDEFYSHVSEDSLGSIDKYNFKSNTIGFYTNYIYHYKNLNIYSGINGQLYARDHKGQTWDSVNLYRLGEKQPYLYSNTGYRNEASAFVKMTFNVLGFNIFQDYQYRFSTFRYDGDVKMDNFNWNFFNPTIGIEKSIGNTTLYYSIGQTHREPTRNDIFGGYDNLLPDYIRMKPESVIDNELGFRYFNNKLAINTNFYYMKFTDESVLSGEYGPTGLPLHINVDNSFRSGLEVDIKYKVGNLILSNNSSISNNKVKIVDKELNPVLSPNIILNQDVLYKFGRFVIGLNGRYQGESYIDWQNQYKLDDFFCLNSTLKFSLGKLIEIDLFVNNITNKKFYTNGLISSGVPLYFRQSGINYFLNFKLKF
jgi:iron complex outermembrane receptor protein